MGGGALMSKFDLKSAYHNIPVHSEDRWLLGMMWDGQLFVDVALPFGLRSAPNAVADALAFVIRHKGVKWLKHYLDDFIIVEAPESDSCGWGLKVALGACEETGVR